MNIVKVGDSQKAACGECQSFQPVTFALRDVPFSDDSGLVKNVLVGVCDTCDAVAVLPHQSTPAVQKQLQVQRKALESRVPAHMIDILNLASTALSGGTEFVQSLVKYYIYALAVGDMSLEGFTESLKHDLAQGKAQKRLSLKGRKVGEQVETLKALTELSSTTDIIKGIVLKIHQDVLVNKDEDTLCRLRSIVAASA